MAGPTPSVAGTVNNGDTVTVHQTSSANFSTLTTATLTIGGVNGAFNVTTLAATTPVVESFANECSVEYGLHVQPYYGERDQYRLSDFHNSREGIRYAGLIRRFPGRSITGIRSGFGRPLSDLVSTKTDVTLTIGGVPGTFSVTTRAEQQTYLPIIIK